MQTQMFLGNMPGGVVIRVSGRGTMHESPAFRAAAELALQRGPLVCDMASCDYLDSTFLGCLVGVRKLAEQHAQRFSIVADSSQQIKLFSLSALNKYFDFDDECPSTIGEWMEIEPDQLDVKALGRHVLVCHECLAEQGGAESQAFEKVVQRLSIELDG
ncbi:STAS domain-containing protein [Aeoliella mucimassa]|uniref:Anti-sigma-B factor antagonist n=1 Tax=Aeoliella mucimassa TaxID=2527972 RepID=A0A518AJP2_9BACT|nr:STAS domain-containing protein [Aeoliella mucimassa]QDU54894.1 Anti-sigma-B factor antagonist [Aeoliella mucimassa]